MADQAARRPLPLRLELARVETVTQQW